MDLAPETLTLHAYPIAVANVGNKPIIGDMKTNEIDWSKVPGVEIDPERQSGVPVFAGTRIPVNVVTNNIRHGGTQAEIGAILDNFSVSREQVNLVLRELRRHEARPLATARP